MILAWLYKRFFLNTLILGSQLFLLISNTQYHLNDILSLILTNINSTKKARLDVFIAWLKEDTKLDEQSTLDAIGHASL